MHHGILPLAILTITLASCGDAGRSASASATSSQAPPAPAKPTASDAMPAAFWKDFQNALRARDSEKIASMTRFPADIGLAEIEGFEGINRREGFIRHFDTIFPKEAVETLLATGASDLKWSRSGSAGKPGHYWLVQHDHDDPLASEGEWSIWYVFSPQPNGDIQLTEVGFAG